MNLPKPTSMKYDELIIAVENGKMKIPQFQRDFVWTKNKSADLLDSIIKGYPIGTFIVWRTSERLKMVGALGNIIFKVPDANEKVDYILDGQQRITSLFVAIKGLKINDVDYASLYVDLSENAEKIIITDVEDRKENEYILFSELMNYSLVDLLEKYDKSKLKLIEQYQNNIKNYDFSVVLVNDTPIEIATEIFTRLNIGGKPLTLFEIMCAKIFDVNMNFDLSEKYEELMNELSDLNFDSISDSLPLQLISLTACHSCKSKAILQLKKDQIIDKW